MEFFSKHTEQIQLQTFISQNTNYYIVSCSAFRFLLEDFSEQL